MLGIRFAAALSGLSADGVFHSPPDRLFFSYGFRHSPSWGAQMENATWLPLSFLDASDKVNHLPLNYLC